MMPSRPFTTLRSQKMRPSDAWRPSERTTLMPRSFLPIVWPLRLTRPQHDHQIRDEANTGQAECKHSVSC